jgi:NosL
MNKKKMILGALLFAAVIGVALWGSLNRTGNRVQTDAERCDFDGTTIRAPYRVEISQTNNHKNKFCSIYCAVQWHSQNPGKAAHILVVDEPSGKLIDARQAVYVRSRVISVPEVKNELHVFAKMSDAQAHARQFAGRIVPNPFEK